MKNTTTPQVDHFFTGTEARYDRWRGFLELTRQWAMAAEQRNGADAIHAELVKKFAELRQWESFYAYPGSTLINFLNERLTSGDVAGTVRLARTISTAVVTHSYRTNVGEWEKDEDSQVSFGERLPIGSEQNIRHRPYFEVLVVSPARPASWKELSEDLRRLRRPQDKFVYETVFVGNFEDAVLATIINGSLEAAVIYDDVPFESSNHNPLLREFLRAHLNASDVKVDSLHKGLTLGQALKLLRPELDIYLLSDREVEKAAGSVEGICARRIFYQVEEPLELHLSILDGISDRYSTPFFANPQDYT